MLRTLGTILILTSAFLVAFAVSTAASPITYTWVGDNGFTGFFTVDSSVFVGGMTGFQVPDTNITAFSFTGDGVTFDFGDVGLGHSAGAAVVFDTTVSPPRVTDGAGGDIADDAAGDEVSLAGADFVNISLASGGGEDSMGSWVVESSAVPEPSALALLAIGVLSVAFTRRRKST